MSFKRTWFWLLIAGGLLAFILLFQRRATAPPASAVRILPSLKASAVKAIQISIPGQAKDLRAERTNDAWQLTQPLVYPAQSASVEMLLSVLAQLTPATHFTQTEVENPFHADKNYGFTDPQATILLEQPGESFGPIRIGTNTPPGNQVFVQVVGRDEIYVVDAAILNFIPRSPSAWRDTSFLHLKSIGFDGLTVASGNNRLSFQTDPATHLWRMTYPYEGRADNEKLTGFLQALEQSRIQQFVSDQTNVDLMPFGLQSPEHELIFTRGTNVVTCLQFGKSPTNDTTRVYALRSDRPGVVTMPKAVLLPWSASMQMGDYRDPYLLHNTEEVSAIDVQGAHESFSLQRGTNNTWRVLPRDFPADTATVNEFLGQLNHLRIVEFTKDTVLDSSLAEYGLAEPWRKFTLRRVPAGVTGAGTNAVAELSFGLPTNRADLVYARRADEKSVYGVPRQQVDRLPALFDYQMRERRVFHFSIDDVTGATLVQDGRVRQLKRNGPHSWSLLPGSEGTIQDLAVEETVDGLCQMAATRWVARGEQNCADFFRLVPPFLKITLDLKSGEKATVTISKPSGAGPVFASVTLEGQPWGFLFPASLLPDVLSYLTVP